MNIRKSDKGFTIIEVVIVLAIAGLIFAIVFWALPNLQKNQRDNTRRNVVGNVVANLDQHAANLNGSYPDSGAKYVAFLETFYDCTAGTSYSAGMNLTTAGCDLEDPLADVLFTFNTAAGSEVDSVVMDKTADPIGSLKVYANASCSSDVTGAINGEGSSSRAFATLMRLENGLSYCQDNT